MCCYCTNIVLNVTKGDKIVTQEGENVRQNVRQENKDVRQENVTQSATQERDNVTQGDIIVIQENKDVRQKGEDVRQDVRYTRKNSVLDKNLSNLIIDKIKSNNKIRLNEIAIEAGVSERTIRRYIKSMPNVKYIGSGYSGHWEII